MSLFYHSSAPFATPTSAASLTYGSGQSAFIGTALPGGPQSQTFTRFFFRLSALENSTVLAVARDANSQQVWEVSYNASEHGLDVYFWDSSGGLHWFSTGTNVLSANTWYSVEVQDSETANGVGQAWLNGAAFGSVSADLSTPTPYAQLLLYSTGEGTLSFDDVVVSDRYTGTAPLGSLVDQTWLATATASSDTPANEQTADKAIDGVIDGYPGDPTREWVTQGGGVGSWLKLTWGSPQTVSRLVLYDRPNLNDQITGGTIQFSDGSSLTIGALNNDGSATIFTFPARTITSVQLTVTAVGGSTQNVGLAEFQVFNATSGTSDPTTVTTRSFYDGNGHLVETRTPGPNGQDVVQYAYYDPSTRTVFSSQAYFVAAYTGDPGAAAYSLPDSSQAGSSTTYNTLRSTTVTDALSNQTTTSNSVVCNAPGTSDGACYVQTTVVDALGHQSSTLTDAFGRELYDQEYTGNSPSTYALYATTKYTYDAQGNLVQILQPDGATLTAFLYDAGGHQIRLIDPDRGTELSFYDADGNATLSVDARGSAGTVYAGYDALDRQLWRSTTNSPTGAYVSYTYDGIVPSEVSCSGITPGSNALGQMTTERFTSGPNNIFTGSYCYGYDARGQVAGEVDTLDGTTYAPIQYAYNDAGMLLQLTYPTTASERYTYDAQGWLSSITRSAEGTTASLVSALSYTGAAGAAGAAGMPDSYVLGGTGACSAANSSILCASFSYDGNLRPTQMTYTHPTSSTPITDYSLGVGYDAVGNITSLSSGVPAVGGQSGGQDNQQFCYDEQDRLTWAGNSGTNPCTGQEVTGTTLPTGSSYTASYQYDVMGRIAQSTLTGALATNPQGAYTYDSQHLHAVDTIGGTGGYTAQYDATGAMTCRAPTGTQTCLSNQTGAQLTYDGEGRLIQWVSADGATTVSYGYDGEGQRFELQVTSGETTTTTTYIGDLEEVQKVSGGATTKMVYFYWGGQQIAEDDNTHWYYPITDHLTSTTVEVDYTGVTAAELFGPYGQVRWAGGTMPTSFAFTGQRSDSATGLDYYGARYYDPQAGRFISADAVLDGQDRYAYVGNNPIEHIDPSGHDWLDAAFSVGLSAASTAATCLGDAGGCAGHALDSLSNWSGMQQDLGTLFNPYSDTGERAAALADFGFSVFIDATVLADGGDWFGNAAKNILEKYAARPKAEWEDAKWLYRGLSSHDDPLQGLHPWNPEDRRFTVIQHVESGSVPGFKGDQYISTTRFFDIAKNKYSMPGIPVAMIDSTKIVGHLIDLSTDPGRYAAGLDPILTPRAWKFSRSDYEVLIEGWVPPEAIRLIPPDWNFHRQGLPDPLPPLGS